MARYESEEPTATEERQEAYEVTMQLWLLRQGGCCAICRRDSDKWHLDHDHSVGCHPRSGWCQWCVRGVLCQRCNTAIGMLGDDVAGVLRAARYLAAARDRRRPLIAASTWLEAVS